MPREYQICTNSIMDTSDRDIIFDENGQCNHCKKFNEYAEKWPFDTEKGKEQIERIV